VRAEAGESRGGERSGGAVDSPAAFHRPPTVDLVLLTIAVVGISTSAPVIRQASAPSMSIAFWRNAISALVLAVPVLLRPASRRELLGIGGPALRRSVLAGVLLGVHFAVWIPSLSFTSVASSTALVATQPVWAACIARARRQDIPRRAWVGIAVAVVGACVVSGVDLDLSARAFAGDMLAVAGAAAAAAYVTAGAEARRTLSNDVYVVVCFSAAALVLGALAVGSGAPLTGYSRSTWGWILGLTIGAQLLGHAVFNRVLRTTSPTIVSVSILFEVVGATLLAWVWFGERPSSALVPAAVLIAGGVVLVVQAGRRLDH